MVGPLVRDLPERVPYVILPEREPGAELTQVLAQLGDVHVGEVLGATTGFHEFHRLLHEVEPGRLHEQGPILPEDAHQRGVLVGPTPVSTARHGGLLTLLLAEVLQNLREGALSHPDDVGEGGDHAVFSSGIEPGVEDAGQPHHGPLFDRPSPRLRDLLELRDQRV